MCALVYIHGNKAIDAVINIRRTKQERRPSMKTRLYFGLKSVLLIEIYARHELHTDYVYFDYNQLFVLSAYIIMILI